MLDENTRVLISAFHSRCFLRSLVCEDFLFRRLYFRERFRESSERAKKGDEERIRSGIEGVAGTDVPL